MNSAQTVITTPKKYLSLLTLIYFVMLFFQLGLGLYFFLKIETPVINKNNLSLPLMIMMPFLALLIIKLFDFVFTQKIQAIKKNEQTLYEKLAGYQTIFINKIAIIEAITIAGLVLFFIYDIAYTVLISIILMGYYLTLMPSKEKIMTALNFNFEQRIAFNKSNEVIN